MNLYFAHLCFYQQPLAYSLVPNEHFLVSGHFIHIIVYLLVQGAKAEGGNPGTQEEIEINI